MLVYFPAWMAATVSFLDRLWSTGSHMFDCPEQYHMSPNVTCASVALLTLVQPVHFAVME